MYYWHWNDCSQSKKCTYWLSKWNTCICLHDWDLCLVTSAFNGGACFMSHLDIWAAPSEFVTYRLCEQRRFRRACASAQSRQNLRCSLIQAVSQKEPSNRKPDPWPLWMAGHAQLKFVMTECSKTQIRLTGLIYHSDLVVVKFTLEFNFLLKFG